MTLKALGFSSSSNFKLRAGNANKKIKNRIMALPVHTSDSILKMDLATVTSPFGLWTNVFVLALGGRSNNIWTQPFLTAVYHDLLI